MVRIRMVSYLSKVVGFKEREIEVSQPTTIRELIGLDNFDEERVIVLVDEQGASLDSTVSGEEMIKILPLTGGG